MRSALSEMTVIRPKSLDQALGAMHEGSNGARPVPIAGGTDLLVYLNAGTPPGTRYLDLWGLRELEGIRAGRASVVLGALTTFREIVDHPVLRRRLPALCAAAATVGAWQIQNRATIAGNIANASPAGDSLPVLLAHDAVVHARSVRGERAAAFDRLYTGYRTLALEADELITAIEIPVPSARSRTWFRKVGTRRAQSISKVVFSGVLRVTGGRVEHARLAFGSVAPVTIRAAHAESTLTGNALNAATVAAAREALARDIAPIDDIRSTRDYRVAVAGNILEQFLRAPVA
jgi:xanthine dehydrogenase small subunit